MVVAMPHNYDKMVILRIAKYYYLDGMSQQEIAVKENIHRSQISRILKLARELGYVQIRISAPDSETADSLSKQVKQRLGLREVFVTPSLSPQTDQDESLYFFAARRLEKILPRKKNIGIGLGKTLYHVASQLTAQKLEVRPDFLSIVGSSGTDNPYLQASVILDNFARPFTGRCHYNNFPICVARNMMSSLDTRRFSELQKAYQMLDTVVLSIGGSLNVDYPYLEEFFLFSKDFDTSQAVARPNGNLLGHIFYDNHECLSLPNDYLMTSMNLQILEKVPEVICIANGKQKVDPIISAARQNYIKSLITDESTAQSIIHRTEYYN